jgi:hypothetical protein
VRIAVVVDRAPFARGPDEHKLCLVGQSGGK